ncbi:HAMP domain-containing sensor histidine kinase [Streptomyces sp. NPDC002490]|uniref:sensor histidine kinase n=1 Tax=Streptomyces sp. NPDC002490 TaxID=3154416 RepID=UPI00332E13CA
MSVTARSTRRAARSGGSRRTVRAKMTILHGVLFLASGAVLLAITYLLVRYSPLGDPPMRSSTNFIETPDDSVTLPPPDAAGQMTPDARVVMKDQLTKAASKALIEQRADLLRQLLLNSFIALGVVSLFSVALGWIVSGRMLRPLRTITAAARDISATHLHRRLDLDGPPDELKELGDTFDALMVRLERSFLAQRQFVANASHELRTPLARQRALGQVALSDPEATADSLRRAHERILAAGAQQERLLEALLTLTRSHAGIEVRHPFDLAQLVEEVVEAQSAGARDRSVALTASVTAAVASGHRPLAERLVVNLVENALKYNVPGGVVEVGARTVAGRAVLTVVNTGPVVPPDKVETLFQPFQRLGGTRTGRRADGLGLGLSIVQAVATAHDATVTTEPRPQGGLSVTVSFPGERGSAPDGVRPGRAAAGVR